jgi:hypothetical protein
LRLRGKRDRERIAYATNGGRDALDDWIAIRGSDRARSSSPFDGLDQRGGEER